MDGERRAAVLLHACWCEHSGAASTIGALRCDSSPVNPYMSTVPHIDQIVVLPTFSLSLSVTPPTDITAIGTITSYRLTANQTSLGSPDVISSIPFVLDEKRQIHYLQGVALGDWAVRGITNITLTIAAIGSMGTSGESATFSFDIQPKTSPEETLRQRICDLISAACAAGHLTYAGGDTIHNPSQTGLLAPYVHRDWAHRPESIPHNLTLSKFPAIEVGIAVSANETFESEFLSVPIRIILQGINDDDTARTIAALRYKLRYTIERLALNNFGIGEESWNWQKGPVEWLTEKTASVPMTMTIERNKTRDETIW